MISNARNPIRLVLALLGLLSVSSPVFAADYSVDFGAETDAGRDADSLTCVVERTCSGEMKSLGLRASFFKYRNEPQRVRVELSGSSDRHCCYFGGGAGSLDIDLRDPLSRVSFYRGVKARGAVLIENERVGTLYLRFKSR